MADLLTSAQMRAIETAAIESGAVTGLLLMERAGQGVVDAVRDTWPELDAGNRHAVILCGPGNNGGDGFVIARLLNGLGWTVEVFLYGDPDKLPPDAKANYDRWTALGPVGDVRSDFDSRRTWQGADLAVDALFGTGLVRPLEDLTQVLFNLWDAADIVADPVALASGKFNVPRVVAVDIPSGLDADSGRVLEPSHHGQGAAAANLTVSFHAMKLGHVLGDGPDRCGKTVVADIGLRSEPDAGVAQLVEAPAPGVLTKAVTAHKYDHGHALVLSGGPGRGGAARLAARAALRVGAGLVTVGCPPAALTENAARLDAVMLRPVADGAALQELLVVETRLNAVCLGPGLGLGSREDGLVAAVLGASAGRPTVLDADALRHLSETPTLFAGLHDGCVLTPHMGEFARLFPDLAARLAAVPVSGPAYSKLDAVREAAQRAGCTVLLKGPDTLIADHRGRAAIHPAFGARAAPWLATAGSGDVLAGLIAGLMARHLPPFEAAEAAVWLHVTAARRFGPGLIAEDLADTLPAVFREMGL